MLFFMCLLAVCIPFLEKYLIKSFAQFFPLWPFFNRLLCCYWIISILYILFMHSGFKSFIRYMTCKYFPPCFCSHNGIPSIHKSFFYFFFKFFTLIWGHAHWFLREGERERNMDVRKTLMWERNIDLSLPVHILTMT